MGILSSGPVNASTFCNTNHVQLYTKISAYIQLIIETELQWGYSSSCLLPNQPKNGKYFISGSWDIPPERRVPGETFLYYQCNKDYVLSINIQYVTCQNGQWVPNTFPTCIETKKPGCVDSTWDKGLSKCVPTCMLPNQPINGNYSVYQNKLMSSGDRVDDGTYIAYRCIDKYALYPDNMYIVCVMGKWSASFPSCLKMCPIVKSTRSLSFKCELNNQNVNCDMQMFDGIKIKSMACKHNYKPMSNMKPNYSVSCINGSWSGHFLKCQQTDCGHEVVHTYDINNNPIEKLDYPWNVGVYRKNRRNKGSTTIELICGGTIVSSKIIISAAHCFSEPENGTMKPAENYLIEAGKYYREFNDNSEENTQKLDIHTILLAPNYHGKQSNFNNNLAVVILLKEITFINIIQPVCIDWTSTFSEEQQTTFGTLLYWDLPRNTYKSKNDELNYIAVQYVDLDVCRQNASSEFLQSITPNKFCGKHISSMCQVIPKGGSGLVFFNHQEQKYYLKGIAGVNFKKNDKCGMVKFEVYTQVSYYMDFISNLFEM